MGDNTISAGTSVAIIGAGVSGLCLALDLQRKGFTDFTIYERDDSVGGSWNRNRYPVDAVLYSHSRYPNPNWTQTHPPREELHQYWVDLAEKQGLMSHIRFRAMYVKGTWQAEDKTWEITLQYPSEKVTVRHDILVSAIGGFSIPRIPSVPGLDGYKGQVFHSLDWPRDLGPKDLRGKQVMVVGSGCSGVQIVSTLARDPEINVTVVSKSKQWFAPGRKGPEGHTTRYSRIEKSLHQIPFILWLVRLYTYVQLDKLYIIIRPSSVRFRKLIEKKLGGWLEQRAPDHLKGVMVPDFPYGAKRIIFDGGYLHALKSLNVTAVWDSIASATPDAVVTANGMPMMTLTFVKLRRLGQTFSPDFVVLATGFRTDIGIEIHGRDGHAIIEDRSHTKMYYGTTIPGYPNLFVLLGANVAAGIFSVLFHIEVQSENVSEIIVQMRKHGVREIEVKEEASDRWNAWLDKRLEKSIWNSAKHYMRADGGTGRIFTSFPGPGILWWWINYSIKWDDYKGAEPIARSQRLKRRAQILGALALAGALAWRFLV
ncbi:hypothetical protein DB88DRAFT_510568 [Papiliotrema laurentii]|uniref:FAD/NAD(P)-binding domain-containing protein n=1 Tax=Papiliotrema laurentii TaxID=5418 RepID=A0AAD9FP56_PAPLA|nr:hypothetical protein DB88DRAFT_510568 [Papiliotrema laurentii]